MITNELKTFICIADCGSFNKAAEKLYISPTAVMKQMNFLENRLGLTLMVRSSHGIRLTECGKSVYKDAKFLISYSENAIENAKKIAETKEHILRVGTSILNPCKTFMDLWYKVSSRFPQYKIQIIPFEDDHHGILSVIKQIGDKFDFIVGVCDSKTWLSRCNMMNLGYYKICVSVPYHHRLSSKNHLKLTELYGETLMMVRRGDSILNDTIRDDLEKNNPQIHIEDTEPFYDIDVFNHCNQSGNLLLNIECWKDIHPALVTIPIDMEYTIPYGLLYSLNPSKEIIVFLDALKEFIKS